MSSVEREGQRRGRELEEDESSSLTTARILKYACFEWINDQT